MTRLASWIVALVMLSSSATSEAGWHAELRESAPGGKATAISVWYDAGKLRLDRNGRSVVYDFVDGGAIVIDHARKTYRTLTLDQLIGFRGDSRRLIKNNAGWAPEYVDNIDHGIPSATPTHKTRKLGKLSCEVYVLHSQLFDAEICAAKDLGVDWTSFREHAMALRDKIENKTMLPMLVELAPLGFPVEARMQTTVFGKPHVTSSVLLSIVPLDIAPDKLVAPPAYTHEEFEFRSATPAKPH